MINGTIYCTIWRYSSNTCRITVDDMRFRHMGTACICDLETMIDSMLEIKQTLLEREGYRAVFEVVKC